MLKWALIFFIVSVIAGLLGFTGVAAGAAGMIAQARRRHRFRRKNWIDRLAPHAAQYGWLLPT